MGNELHFSLYHPPKIYPWVKGAGAAEEVQVLWITARITGDPSIPAHVAKIGDCQLNCLSQALSFPDPPGCQLMWPIEDLFNRMR